MIASFSDESGNDGQSVVFAMATILVSHESSYYFGNDWRRMLAEFGVTEFHAADFYGRRNEFSRWPAERTAAMQSAIIKLLQKWEVRHSAALVTNDDYKRSFVETGFNRTIVSAPRKWMKPYLTAFQHTVIDLREFADYQLKGTYIVPVFDNCQEFMAQAREFYDQRNADGKLGQMQVASQREYVQIQAADFFAWEYRIRVEDSLAARRPEPGPVLEAVRKYHFGARLWSFDYLEHLRQRIDAVNSGIDPETLSAPDSCPWGSPRL